ncbi:MAG: hypothetical protein FWH56_08635 [Betaproteobacteria bacterium]|nr:hypothetical protein [Betaproteobacteria bacterium]
MTDKIQNPFPWMLLALLCAALAVTGCEGSRNAYSEAKTVDEKAYVVVEHYSALVKEAADLAEKPNTPREAVEAMKKADAAAMPVMLRVRNLRNAWQAAGNAENAEALQMAVNDATMVIADMIRAVKQARGETP